MVNSISSMSTSSVQSTSTSSISDEEKKKKAEEEGLFTSDNNDSTQTNTTSSTITEDTAQSTASSYIASLKAQYPQLASKLDSYLSNLDYSTLCAEATSISDVKAYIYNETQSYFKEQN